MPDLFRPGGRAAVQRSGPSEQILGFLRRFLKAWRLRNLYPPSHATCRQAINDAYQSAIRALNQHRQVVIVIRSGLLLVNDEPLERPPIGAETLVREISKRGIESLTFDLGLLPAEFDRFMALAGMQADDIQRQGGPEKMLMGQLPHMGINRVRYVRVDRMQTRKEIAATEAARSVVVLDYLLGRSRAEAEGGAPVLARLVEEPRDIAAAIENVVEEETANIGDARQRIDAIRVSALSSLERLAELMVEAGPQEWNRLRQNLAQVVYELDAEIRDMILTGQPEDADEAIRSLTSGFSYPVQLRILFAEHDAGIMSGSEVAEAVRAIARTPAERQAWIDAVDAERAAGSAPDLCDALIRELREGRVGTSVPEQARLSEFTEATVVVAEGDADTLEMYSSALRNRGFNVLQAPDGEEVLKWVDLGMAELIVLDMRLPKVHGLEVLAHLKQEHARIPVVICTAFAEMKEEFVVRSYPELALLEKPVSLEQLIQVVEEMLSRARQRAGR